jgi:glycine/D-amino acid oxidase-like deaminating enzyme
MKVYRSYSLWLDGLAGTLDPRPALPGDIDVDVAVVGAGLTGLWTVYYLAKADPKLRIAVLEKEIAGWAASGRNGGWCSPYFAANKDEIAKIAGRDAAIAMQRAMFATVDEVGRVVADEKIDARFRKGGALTFVTAPAQMDRVREEVEYERSWGFTEEDMTWLGAEEARARIDVAGCLGAAFTRHCACVDPARLARGLAAVVEGLGVTICEQTRVTSIEKGVARTAHGAVRADAVVRATEAFTVELPGESRTYIPLYSLMVATEPLPKAFWKAVGWKGYEVFGDGRHLIIYTMRTADDRIAMGGRGAPYHYGSRIDDFFEHEPHVFDSIRQVVRDLFPAIGEARFTHEWGGPIAAPRDWHSSVGFDRESGLGLAGGYVGDGVSTTNLAGRTLRDLILGEQTDLVALPWVNHHSRSWEPEPLRWLAVNLALKAMGRADRVEAETGRQDKAAELIKKLIGA